MSLSLAAEPLVLRQGDEVAPGFARLLHHPRVLGLRAEPGTLTVRLAAGTQPDDVDEILELVQRARAAEAARPYR